MVNVVVKSGDGAASVRRRRHLLLLVSMALPALSIVVRRSLTGASLPLVVVLGLGGFLLLAVAGGLGFQFRSAKRLRAHYAGAPVLFVLGKFADVTKLAGQSSSGKPNSRHVQSRILFVALSSDGPVVELLSAWIKPSLGTCRLPQLTNVTVSHDGEKLRSVEFDVNGQVLVLEGRHKVDPSLVSIA